MIINRCLLAPWRFKNTNLFRISTDIIKRGHERKELSRKNPDIYVEYPKTFEEKMMVLNNPKTL